MAPSEVADPALAAKIELAEDDVSGVSAQLPATGDPAEPPYKACFEEQNALPVHLRSRESTAESVGLGSGWIDFITDNVRSRIVNGAALGGVYPLVLAANSVVQGELWSDVPLEAMPPKFDAYGWWLFSAILGVLLVLPACRGNHAAATLCEIFCSMLWSMMLTGLGVFLYFMLMEEEDYVVWWAGLYTTINYGIIMIFYINLIVREMCSKQTKWQEKTAEVAEHVTKNRTAAQETWLKRQQLLTQFKEELSEEDYTQLLLPMLNAHWRRAATADPDAVAQELSLKDKVCKWLGGVCDFSMFPDDGESFLFPSQMFVVFFVAVMIWVTFAMTLRDTWQTWEDDLDERQGHIESAYKMSLYTLTLCSVPEPTRTEFMAQSTWLFNESEEIHDFSDALRIACIVGGSIAGLLMIRAFKTMLVAYRQVAIEMRQDGNLSRHLARFGFEDLDEADRAEEAFSAASAMEFVGQFVIANFVGGFFNFLLLGLITLVLAWAKTRDVLLDNYQVLIWIIAGKILDKFLVQKILVNKVLTDGMTFKKPKLFAIVFPLLQVWYILVGWFEGMARLKMAVVGMGTMLLRVDTTIRHRDATDPSGESDMDADHGFGSFCAMIRMHHHTGNKQY